jgi:hypothetical protein
MQTLLIFLIKFKNLLLKIKNMFMFIKENCINYLFFLKKGKILLPKR